MLGTRLQISYRRRPLSLERGCDNRGILNSLSVVSKQFLSITNRIQFSLTLNTPALSERIFRRFINLTSLNLSCYNSDLNVLLPEISRFPLNLTSLNLSYQPIIPTDGLRVFSQNITTLNTLICSGIKSINSTDMSLIADCFPLLEELDLRNPVNCNDLVNFLYGEEVEELSLAFFKLRKVNLTDHYYVNGKFLFQLFKSCKLLEEAIVLKCVHLTEAGIAAALLERPTLRSLSFTFYKAQQDYATLFAFIRNCPSLSEIRLDYNRCWVESIFAESYNSWMGFVVNYNSLKDFVVSPQIKSLSLQGSGGLKDENIETFASVFPNLQLLDLSHCIDMSEEDICQILRRCCEIRELNLAYFSRMRLRKMNFEVPKLESLNLSHTKVDDEALFAISKSCSGLLQLSLENCCNVTEKGVKHVVENCTQLRMINLRNCHKVHPDVVAPMLLSKPSLRKIISPTLLALNSETIAEV